MYIITYIKVYCKNLLNSSKLMTFCQISPICLFHYSLNFHLLMICVTVHVQFELTDFFPLICTLFHKKKNNKNKMKHNTTTYNNNNTYS